LKADAWPTDVVVSQWYISNRVYTYIKDTAATDKPLDMSYAAPAAKPGADGATVAADPAQDGSPTDVDLSTPAIGPLTDYLSASGWRMPCNSIT